LMWILLYSLGMDGIENTTSNSSSSVVCVSIIVGACLPSCCLAVTLSSRFSLLAFSPHVTLFHP
jgi:fucose permease